MRSAWKVCAILFLATVLVGQTSKPPKTRKKAMPAASEAEVQALKEEMAAQQAAFEKQIQELRDHLAKKNPYFALWTVYKVGVNDRSIADGWDDFLLLQIGIDSPEEVVFIRAMVELDKLLSLFHDSNRALPRHFYERAWFLHYLREPERMLQTRSLLNMLTAEIAACTSA